MAKKTTSTSPILAPDTILELVIPTATGTRAYQQALTKRTRTFKAAGFRQGKAPQTLVEQTVGREELIQLALEQILPVAYSKLIEKSGKQPLTQPEIKLISADPDQEWKLEVHIAEKSPVKLGRYKSVVKKGLTAGKKAVADAKKHQQEHPDHPDLTDNQIRDIKLKEIFTALVQAIAPQVPELLVKEEVRYQLQDLVKQLDQYQLSLDDYLKRQGQTFEQLSTQMAANAISRFQVDFILDAIIEAEKLVVSDQDITTYLNTAKVDRTVAQLDEHTKHHLTESLLKNKCIEFLLALE